MQKSEMTIGRLAKAADVGIETIRYYQRLNLLPTPSPGDRAYRYYPMDLVDRIRFIKRSQDLGFSLDEISKLLKLEDGSNRRAIRKIALTQLDAVRAKIADLKKMEGALAHMIHDCEHASTAQPCPIIATLAGSMAAHDGNAEQ